MPFLFFVTLLGISFNSFAATQTFEERKSEVAACNSSEKNGLLNCASKNFNFYKDVTQRNLYKGHNTDEVIENLKSAAEKNHVAANFYYTLYLMGKGDPSTYQAALKTKSLFEGLSHSEKGFHDLGSIKGLAVKYRSQPKQDIDILVQRAEILDPKNGPLLDKKEIWSRIQPVTSESNGKTHTGQIYGLTSLESKFAVHGKEFYPLFIKAAELKVPEAIYHIGRMHLSRTAPDSQKMSPKADFDKYEAYMEQAKSIKYPRAFMEKDRILYSRKSSGFTFAQKQAEKRKWKEEAISDLRKATDLNYPPAHAALGKRLVEKAQAENDETKKAKLKSEALQHITIAKNAGEKNIDKEISYLQNEKAFLAQEQQSLKNWEANQKQQQIYAQQKEQKDKNILSMLKAGNVRSQADVDYICANSKRSKDKNKGDNCTWAQAQLAQRGYNNLKQQERNSQTKWQGFTYTKETTDRANRAARESKEKNDMNQFKKNLNHQINSKGR